MRVFLSNILLFAAVIVHAQPADVLPKYLGQKSPSAKPEVFAPGLISKQDEYEFGSVFNKAGTAFYYAVDLPGGAEIRYTKLEHGGWTAPETILSHAEYGFNDPFLSPDEQRLYFISKKALQGTGAKQDYDIWYVELENGEWSEPINAGPQINTTADEYYISFTSTGTMYFSSNKKSGGNAGGGFDIYAAESVNGQFQKPAKLGSAINTSAYEADVFVAPDESYLIFCANRPEGMGRGDLYISFKQEDGSWTKSINMGNEINTNGHELCPFVSADGKYFFYTSNQDIHWVSTQVFSDLRAQNR